MISRENYFEPHIRELQNSSKGDPGLINGIFHIGRSL